MRDQYQVHKKIFSLVKNPVRLIYEKLYGTTIGPLDELCYIGVCLWETLNIVGSHYKKKIFPEKMDYKLIARDRVFCEGTLSECQKCLTGIAQMISAGFSTDFQVQEFLIMVNDCEVKND